MKHPHLTCLAGSLGAIFLASAAPAKAQSPANFGVNTGPPQTVCVFDRGIPRTCAPFLTVDNATHFVSLQGAALTVDKSPLLAITPTGNAVTTLAGVNIQSSSASSTTREMFTAIGFAMNTGSAGAHVTADDKAALYVGGTCSSGAKACWSINDLMTLNTPLHANFFAALTRESDFNNLSGNSFHTAYGAVGAFTQFVGNELITGASTSQADFAIGIGGLNTNTGLGMYNRGIIFMSGLGATKADVQSEDASQSMVADFGSHTQALDLKGTYSTAAIVITPAGVSLPTFIITSGTGTSTLWNDATTIPNGLLLNGTYSNGAILVSSGSKICLNVTSNCFSYDGTEINVPSTRVRSDSGFRVPTVTVASLPSCTSGLKGTQRTVSDASAVSYGSTVTGGGGNFMSVTCDGTNWKEL